MTLTPVASLLWGFACVLSCTLLPTAKLKRVPAVSHRTGIWKSSRGELFVTCSSDTIPLTKVLSPLGGPSVTYTLAPELTPGLLLAGCRLVSRNETKAEYHPSSGMVKRSTVYVLPLPCGCMTNSSSSIGSALIRKADDVSALSVTFTLRCGALALPHPSSWLLSTFV